VAQAELEAESAETAVAALTSKVQEESLEELLGFEGDEFSIKLPPPQTALQAARTAEELRQAALPALDAVLSDLKRTLSALEEQLAGLPADSGSRVNYSEARTKLLSLRTRVGARRSAIDSEELTESLQEATETALRRVAAEQWSEEQSVLFERYDRDCDRRLCRKEVVALAMGLYDLDASEAFLDRVMRILSHRRGNGVAFEQFRRLRQMLGIELSEVRQRERIEAEAENKRRNIDEVERRRRDIADRKLKAQSLLDDASEFLSDVAAELPKVEEAGRSFLSEERLNSAALRGVCSDTEVAFQALDVAFAGARAKLEEASEVLRLEGADVNHFLRPEIVRMEARLVREEEKRAAPLRKAMAEAKDKVSKKEFEEERSAKQKKVLSKLEQAFEEQEDGDDSDFDNF